MPDGRKHSGLYVLKHEYKQSTHTYDMDISTSYQALQKGHMMEEYLTQTETVSLKKTRYDCFEDNTMHPIQQRSLQHNYMIDINSLVASNAFNHKGNKIHCDA